VVGEGGVLGVGGWGGWLGAGGGGVVGGVQGVCLWEGGGGMTSVCLEG